MHWLVSDSGWPLPGFFLLFATMPHLHEHSVEKTWDMPSFLLVYTPRQALVLLFSILLVLSPAILSTSPGSVVGGWTFQTLFFSSQFVCA